MTRSFRKPPIDRGSNTEQRRAHRRAVGFRAGMRPAGLPQFEVDLVDLSTAGFRAETRFILSPGARVWLTLPTLEALEAVVAWRDKLRYGCAFSKPLHPAVFDHIIALGDW